MTLTIQENQIQEHYRHLQHSLDEVTAYFIRDTGKTPGESTILELIEWVYIQTKKSEKTYV